MFTGIIETVGKIQHLQKNSQGMQLTIEAAKILNGVKVGDSIAVNGVCLTVTHLNETSFSVDIIPESIHRSNLGSLTRGENVNLERAMAADGRFDGHIVTGHIDGVGQIEKIVPESNAKLLYIKANQKLLHYIVEKGSITIDGISLTVISVTSNSFSVGIIPHTWQHTNLRLKTPGSFVNLENDYLAKYLNKWLTSHKQAYLDTLL